MTEIYRGNQQWVRADGIGEGAGISRIAVADVKGITLSTTSVAATEGGNDTYTVVLDAAPTADVTVTPAGDSQCSVSSALTFTTVNWATPQVVTVTATDDQVDEDGHTGTVSHTVTSSDTDYNGMGVSNVTMTITDNDTAGVTLSKASVTVVEGGANDTYTIVLDTKPTANVTVTPAESSDDFNFSPASVTFTDANWSTPQTITVTAVDDAYDEDAEVGSITHSASSSDTKYNGIGVASVTVNITDNDTAGVTLSETSIATTEGGITDDYTVVLDSRPTANVTVTPASTTGDSSFSPTSVTFTDVNWATPQTITVTAVNDQVDETSPENDTITHSATSSDPDYNGIGIANVTNAVTDNDTAGVTLSETTIYVTEGGATDDYTVVLDTKPTANVTVTPANAAGEVSFSPTSVTFTDGNWSTPQTITVTAVDDGDVETSPENTTITHSATSSDTFYNGIGIANITAAVTDNDAALDPYDTRVNALSPVAYWRLHGASADARLDETANNNDLTNNGTPTYQATGALTSSNEAVSFSGSGDFLTHANNSYLFPAVGDFSVSLWAKADTLSGTDCIISARDINAAKGWVIYRPTNGWGAIVYDSSSYAATHTTGYSTGTWYHICITWDESESDLKLYVDGSEVASNLTASYAQETSETFYLSRASWTTAIDFAGDVDEVAIFHSVLSGAAITDLANNSD